MAESAAAVAPVAERRLVSVLFADLVGFTPLAESLDAEEVRELLSRYFEICRRLISLYGGTVEKFIGDAVMAVWGTPTATEDDAERAVRAALDLVAAVSALGDEVGAPELRARAGVLTGEAAVTLGAAGEGMVAGDLVNTASRVQSAAEPGSVFVGEATRRATESAIAFQEAGPHALKGKEEPVSLWKAVRVVSGVRGQLKSERLEAPFVGRERELRQIKELFHACAEERKAHLVSLTGVAGIGKSRLAWEFYKYFDGIVEQVWWHRGRCLAYGEGVTYWALADMIRMRCRIAEDEHPGAALAKLRGTLEEHLPDEGERRFVEPRLAQLLGLGDAEAADRQELFAAWRLFFERLADESPVVLVFEDLQWADASLLDFVEYLLEWSRGHPLFVVTLARPELLERRPTWGAGQRSFTSLYLEPLSEGAMQELLNGLVPGVPDGLRAQILARAEGVPLYAVETARMLLDRGMLVQEGPVYAPTTTIEALEVPETLQALIAARLDGLSEQERRLLQDGAVLGKTFTRQALAALTGLSDAELEPLLASLVRKEVLGLQADPRSPEHGQYGFLQDLVSRVAYEMLSKRDRKRRHVAAADHLENGLGEDEVVEVIAAHLLAAYESAPDAADAGELRVRGRDALVRAGERAVSLGAPGQAHRYFEQAADLTEEQQAQAELAFRAGQMAYRANRPVEARALLERAHDVFVERMETRAAARVSIRLGLADFHEGHTQQAIARLEAARAAVEEGEPDADLAAVDAELGRFLVLSGEHERAEPHIERALSLAEALDLPETLVGALNTRAMVLLFRNQNYQARILFEGVLALALDHDLHASVGRAYNNLADALERSDAFADAVAVCDRRLEDARRRGNRFDEVFSLASPLSSLLLLGRWEDALDRAGEAEEHAVAASTQSLLLPVAAIRGERGEAAQARQFVGRLTAIGQSDDPQILAAIAVTEAGLCRAEGRTEEALAAAERALAVVERASDPMSIFGRLALVEALEAATELGDTSRARGLLGTLDGRRPGELTRFLDAQRARFRGRLNDEDTEAHFGLAVQLFRELETSFYLAVTLLEHGEWLAGQGQSTQAEPLLAEAGTIFELLGASPWLARTAQVASSGSQPESVTAGS